LLQVNAAQIKNFRGLFPALSRGIGGRAIAYFDGPGGYQTPRSVIAAMNDYMVQANANYCDQFEAGVRTIETISTAREAFADLFVCGADEVVFGANMTTLNFMLAQALVKKWSAGDRVLITEIDHEANRGPWLGLRERGIEVDDAVLDTETRTLDRADLEAKLARRPRLAAVNWASNGLGTISDVKTIVDSAKEVGALTVIDAVHYAAHGPINVRDLGVDFLLCSAYKFFGPHIGVMYARREAMEKLEPLNLRTQKQHAPFKFETGTLNHEGIAGAAAAVNFMADAGSTLGGAEAGASRRQRLVAALDTFDHYEMGLTNYLLLRLAEKVPQARVYGPPEGHPRTSTVSFTYGDLNAADVAAYLGGLGIFVYGGHFYAIRLVERLGLADRGGLVRVGISPYNTREEVDRLVAALEDESAVTAFARKRAENG
jgi:cysteine desulfurase family protein (TIGR01976 family)